jgi:hypothetical protein
VDVGTATTTTTPATSTTVPTHVTYTLACEERRSGGGWLAGWLGSNAVISRRSPADNAPSISPSPFAKKWDSYNSQRLLLDYCGLPPPTTFSSKFSNQSQQSQSNYRSNRKCDWRRARFQ